MSKYKLGLNYSRAKEYQNKLLIETKNNKKDNL